MGIELATTTEHEDLIPQLARAFAGEWPEWAKTITPHELEAAFRCGADGGLPVVFIAHREGVALGSVSLRQWVADAPMAESPWVRGLYVRPEQRGRGVDRMLLSAVESEARRRGFDALYAATTRIERLAVRRGWKVIRRLDHQGEPMAWLRHALA